MTIRLRDSVLTPISGRGSSFFSGAVHLLNPYAVAPLPDELPLDPIHPVIISPLIIEVDDSIALPLNAASASCYVSLEATTALALTSITPTLIYGAKALHESYYWTPHFKIHQTAYQSENSLAQVLHEVSWENSSFALHESHYQSLASSVDQIQHTVSWASVGSATAANHLHEVSWASVGSASSDSAFHTVDYASFQLVSDYRLHETTWQSLGGSTSAAYLHETSWQSLGGASSASSFHTISWTWSPAIRRQHDVLWKSIEAHERFHTTAWNSDTSIHRLHEARYRSNTTTPTFMDSLFYVRV